MWRITAEGRRFLQALAVAYGDRATFGARVGIGKNQVKPLLDTPDHVFNQSTCEKLRAFAPEFKEGVHFERVVKGNGCEVRLARDRSDSKTLSHYDQQGIERLYEALLGNPEFEPLRPSYDLLPEFRQFLRVWGSASEDFPSEQFFVYRNYCDAVIAFLFGEKHVRTPTCPLTLFAIWYLVGPTNPFYHGSPVQLDAAARQNLPVGERQSATSLAIRLIEELREDRDIDYLFFEVGAQELDKPDSLARLLFRVYARAEEEVKQHFAFDPVLRNGQYYVLDFTFLVPHWQLPERTFTLQPHRLMCCPLKPNLRRPFLSGVVPREVVAALLHAIYEMIWDFYDFDSPQRHEIMRATLEAMERFHRQDEAITCATLRDYVATHFRGKGYT